MSCGFAAKERHSNAEISISVTCRNADAWIGSMDGQPAVQATRCSWQVRRMAAFVVAR
jgi:hypothetical protein